MSPPIRTNNFTRGQAVEVSVEEDGFQGSYFEAKVISPHDNGLITVKYETLLEDNETQFLTEAVYPHQLRPLPPAIPVQQFSVDQKVDAFDNDGWWIGVITKKDGADSYFVYFSNCDEEISYPLPRLRVHQDWIDGKWVRSKEVTS